MLMLFGQAESSMRGLDAILRENWRIVIPLLLGFVGVYLMLPRVKRVPSVLAGAIAALGLVLAGLWWTTYDGIWVEQVLFYIFSGLAILGAGLMLCQNNPVHAALAFALVVLSSCGLFLLCAAPFLMAATIIIYAGAIVVTFLFVIMLAQQAGLASADIRSREPFLASAAGFILLGTMIVILQRGYTTSDMDAAMGTLQQLVAVETKDDIIAALGEPSKGLDKPATLAFESELRKSFPSLKPNTDKENKDLPAALAVDDLEAAWVRLDPVAVKKSAIVLLDHAKAKRSVKGSLVAEVGHPNVLARKPLPARNVAALGRTLFTDYLIAIEMAGVLLLVATIGAIVIATRRTEGLR